MHPPRPSRTLLLLVAGLRLALPARADVPAPGEPEESREEAREEDAPEAPAQEPYRPLTSGPFVTFTAPLTAPGRLVVQPLLSLAVDQGEFDAEGRYLPRSRTDSSRTVALALFLEYGILERLAAGASVVVQHNRRRMGPDVAAFSGPGDTTLFGRGTLLFETREGLPEVTLLAQVKLPTGRAVSAETNLLDTDVLGTGSVDLTLGLDFTKGVRPFLLHADLLYTHALPARLEEARIHYGDSLAWSVSGEWPFLPDALALMVEASGRHQATLRRNGQPEAGEQAHEVLVGAGIEFLFSEELQLLVGYQRTVWGRNAQALDAVVATLVPTLL